MQRLTTFSTTQPEPEQRLQARYALEQGGVVLLDRQPFLLEPAEKIFLTPTAVSPKRKNISYDPITNSLKADTYQTEKHESLKALLKRYYRFAKDLLQQWYPEYTSDLIPGRGSLRVVEAASRTQSRYQDDRYLHVDAFPATPLQGKRILRIFSNINPVGVPRVWRIGESFSDLFNRFASQLTWSMPWKKYCLHLLKLTKNLRTDYDEIMLQLHHKMKTDDHYQQNVDQEILTLPAATSWFVFTDQASHAVCSGQFCLEQTFYLSPHTKAFPSNSPLRILEQYYQKPLI